MYDPHFIVPFGKLIAFTKKSGFYTRAQLSLGSQHLSYAATRKSGGKRQKTSNTSMTFMIARSRRTRKVVRTASTTTLMSVIETPNVIEGSIKSGWSAITGLEGWTLYIALVLLILVLVILIYCCCCRKSKENEPMERSEEEPQVSDRAPRHRHASPPKKHEHHEHRESHEHRERHERHEVHSEKASAKETLSKGSSISKGSSASKGLSKSSSPRRSKTPTAPKFDEFARPGSEKETQTTDFDSTAQTMETMDLQMGRPSRRIDRAKKRLKRLLRLTSREERMSGMAAQQEQARTNILDAMGSVEPTAQTPSVTASGGAPPGYEPAVPFVPTQTAEERR